jgi:hypothetical protein
MTIQSLNVCVDCEIADRGLCESINSGRMSRKRSGESKSNEALTRAVVKFN